MKFKTKNLILSIFLIIIVQILLLINNRQKATFRYLIWNIQDVSIGRLIIFSFVSGLLMSSLLNKTVVNNIPTNYVFDKKDNTINTDDETIERDDINEPNDITPERDLRDPQPTISVNYRVIKNKGVNEFTDRYDTINNSQYLDDWNNDDSEW